MSELFDEEPRDPVQERRASGRSRALVITAVILVVAFFGLTTFANFYTDRLWYRDGGYGSVFSTLLWTRVGLFFAFGLLMALVVAANIIVAFRLRPLFHPQSPEQTGLDRYRQAVTPIRTWLVVGVAALLGIFAGTSASGEWRTFLLWRNGVPFNREDAYFERDIGFYVFDLPWFHYLVDFVMAAAVVSLLAAAVVHYLYGGIRLQTPGDRFTGAAQAQLSVLLGVFVLAKAVDYWLDRYDLVHQSGSLLTGITYTDDNAVLPAKAILMGIALICAVLFFLNVWRRTWLLPSVGLALLVLSAILLGLIWPAIVQGFQVRPSEADKEADYIAKNIAATRAAYDIDTVETYQFSDTVQTAGETIPAAEIAGQVRSIPLVDPQLVHRTFEQNQQVRGYYSVADVLDVDRYVINDEERALVLGVRELDQNGINDSDRNWLNLHTVYTHGNGIIAAYANQRDGENDLPSATGSEDDKTQWAEGNNVGQTDLSEAVEGYETRVYFGEKSPDYSVVGKASEGAPDVELDLQRASSPTDPDEEGSEGQTTYDGAGGVPVGSTFRQLLYAIKFGSTNFLLSGRVNGNSEVIYNRDPGLRVEKVAPWLTIDDDIYPTIVDGRIVWVVDGYTTTNHFPGAELESFEEMTDDSLQEDTGLRTLPTDEINYMRNAVKATVDAYDGTVTLYEWDDQDPILKAWSSAFPGTVKPKEEIPDALLEHLRYPEDLFKVQRYQYARYHVTDPNDWFQGNDRWAVPEDPNVSNNLQPPYRMFVTQPENLVAAPEAEAGTADPSTLGGSTWSLTSTFVPNKRNNLAAYVSVDSDATSESYGQMRVIEVIDDQLQGPGVVNSAIRSDEDVADRVAQFNRSGGTVTYGNLLTVPVGDELLYVEPVYASLAGSSSSYPILRYVLVSYRGEVGIGETLNLALLQAGADDIGGGTEPPPDTDPPDTEPGTGTVDQQIRRHLDQAQTAFEEANAALAQRDLGLYQDKVAEAEGHLQDAIDLANERDAEQGGGTTSGSPSPSESPAGG